MSFETNYAVEGDDIPKSTELDFKPDKDFMIHNPDFNLVHESHDEDEKEAELSVLPTDVVGQRIIKPITKISLRPADPKFELSSLPGSCDASDGESEESAIPLPAVKLNRKAKSLEWTDALLHVATASESTDEKENTRVINPEFELVLTELQYGIKESLMNVPKHPERDLLMTDFSCIEQIDLSNGDTHTCSTNSNSVLHVYAPIAFRFFRDLFGITTDDFSRSVCESPLHYCNTSSRSGSKFFCTQDDRFILKTVPKKEANFLLNLFPGYFLNLTQHTKTLLPKFYGLYRFVNGTKSLRVLIMNNILPGRYKFSEKYDLKGSTYSKRRSRESKKSDDHKQINNFILKDLDFLDRWPDGFYFQHEIHKMLLRSIERDCTVLESYSIMDYSLLMGVVLPDDPNSPVQVTNLGLSSSDIDLKKDRNLIGPFEVRTMKGDTVYLFVGIIDILQGYNWKRKFEYHLKSLFYSGSSISVNRPDFYSQRFQNFLKDSVIKSIPKLVPSSKRECCIGLQRGSVTREKSTNQNSAVQR